MNKSNLSLIGFLQALGVIVYCALVAGFFQFADKFFTTQPNFLGFVLMLVILVFSAAVTGSVVFGYATYLAFNQRIKDALTVFAYTLLYCLGITGIILIAIVLIG